MTASALPMPTRHDEAWRYADMAAVAAAWPVPAPERLIVPAGGTLTREMVQDKGGIHQIELALGKGATAALHILNTGIRYGRIEVNVTLHQGAEFSLGAVQVAGGETTLEIVTTVTHAEPGATSRQTVRSVAGGTASVTYLGRVVVAHGADGTDSEQSVRAILLDRGATANAKPELEIHADDVKCAHGCAVGELDADALFYLQSRGLSPVQARTLLLQAFVATVFDGAPDENDGALGTLQRGALAALEGLT